MVYLVWSYDSTPPYNGQRVASKRCSCGLHYFCAIELKAGARKALGGPGRGSRPANFGPGTIFSSNSSCHVKDPRTRDEVHTRRPPQEPPSWWR
jgi:hypothetical protein